MRDGDHVLMKRFLEMAPMLGRVPGGKVHASYDRDADVLYLTFKPSAEATDSELTDDDVVVRYEGDEVIGFTILHASTR